MAQPNFVLIKYQAENIPSFDGNPKQLNRFIKSCDNFLTAHRNEQQANAPINNCLFDTILSKLIGRAADLIASRTELNTWSKVKESLLLTFSDQRSIDCVVQDIISMRLERGESPQNFGLRLQDARSILFSKINMSNDNNEIKAFKIQQYDDLCLKTFINGLNYHMQLVVRLKNPDSLEQAMGFALEEENFLTYQNRSATINQSETNEVYSIR
jgi:hypothetical protein